jgi:hypothetical protein
MTAVPVRKSRLRHAIMAADNADGAAITAENLTVISCKYNHPRRFWDSLGETTQGMK